MRRAYKFRLYPTRGQEGRLGECLRDHRALYNAALEERRGRWRWNRQAVRYGDQSSQLKDIRSCCPEQGRWSFSSQQATLRRLDKAMTAFFRRLKTGAKAGFPRFKGEDRFDSVEWPKDGDGCRWKPEQGRVYLQGIGAATPTSTGHEMSQPGPGWALVEPLRLEKPSSSGDGAVTPLIVSDR